MKCVVPIEIFGLEEDGVHLLVLAMVNGDPARLIVDTGASRTVFDVNRMRQFSGEAVFEIKDKEATGLGTNTMESHLVVLNEFKIGDLIIESYETVLIDLSHVNESYEKIGIEPIDGVLGGDILLEYKAIIDYSKEQITFDLPDA